jgi:hypothetical protein
MAIIIVDNPLFFLKLIKIALEDLYKVINLLLIFLSVLFFIALIIYLLIEYFTKVMVERKRYPYK